MLRFESASPERRANYVGDDQDDFDFEAQHTFSQANRTKVFSAPDEEPGEDKPSVRKGSRIDVMRIFRCLLAMCLLGLSIGHASFVLSQQTSDVNTILANVFLILGAIGPSIYLAFVENQLLILPGAVFWYSWALISSNFVVIPALVALVHIALPHKVDRVAEVVILLVSISCLTVQIVLEPSENIALSILFLLLGSYRSTKYHQERSQQLKEKDLKIVSSGPRWLILSDDELNTDQIRQDIDTAKSQVEQKRPGLLDRISEIRIDFEDLKLNRKVGFGSFGEVYRAILDDVHVVAVKRIPRDQVSIVKVSSMLTEIDVMSTCSHPNIVKIVGWCDEPYVLACIEYANGGSVRDFLASTQSSLKIGWSLTKTKMAMDAAAAIAYLHGRGILHRDIKADNLLVFCGGENSIIVKLADFGSSRPVDDNPMTAVGSPFWLAPEVARGAKDYDSKADVWSFGVCLCEMITHTLPYEDLKSHESYFNLIGVSQGRIKPSEQVIQAADLLDSSTTNYGNVVRLVERACQYEPRKRPTMNMVMFELLQMMVLEDGEVQQASFHPPRNNADNGSWRTDTTSSIRRISSLKLNNAESDDELGPLHSPQFNKKEHRRISDPTSSRKNSLLGISLQ